VFSRPLAAVLLFLLTIGCARRPADPAVEKMAVLRFENLGSDFSADWMGRAFAEVLSAELSEAPDLNLIPPTRLHSYSAAWGARPASVPGVSAERSLALAAGATRIVYGNYDADGGRVRVHLTIEDPRTGRMQRVLSATAPDLYSAASTLANRISPGARPYSTQNIAALKAYSIALESDASQAMSELEEAIAADPNFPRPYELLAQFKVQRQDRDGAAALLQSAIARGVLPAAGKARIEFELANLRGDATGRLKALTALTGAMPRDAGAWHSLGDALLMGHQYNKAVEAYRKAVDLDPEDITAWNQLGYASAYAGDLNAGMNALRRYQALRPADPNPLDSMGDLNLMAGKLREAEQFYLDAAKKNAAVLNHADLFKAAMARLMTGDIPGADGLARQYAQARAAAKDPQIPLFDAEWLWLTGRRREACRSMETLAQSAGQPLATRANNEAALWYLMLGDRDAAARAAGRVQPPGAAAVPRFLLAPAAPPDEWLRRADALVPNPAASGVRDTITATALLLAKDFAAASPILQRLYEGPAGGSDPAGPVALAWTWMETGRAADAAPLLRSNPIPPVAGPSPFLSLYFPRYLFLRAKIAGSPEQARENYRLFLQLSGPDPLLWGEEQQAQAALR
jgi:Flp pilus assembly protein TadD